MNKLKGLASQIRQPAGLGVLATLLLALLMNTGCKRKENRHQQTG